MDVRVKRLTAEDIPAAMELKDPLGWNQTPADWARFLAMSPSGALKAVAGGELVGTAVTFLFQRLALVAMLLVRPDLRGLGVGTALMRRCLEIAREGGAEAIQLDATADGVPLYHRLGFRGDTMIGTVSGRPAPAEPVRPALELRDPRVEVRSARLADLPAVLELDRDAVGVDRQSMLEPLLAEQPECGFVALREGKPLGYLLHRQGHHSTQVGPLIARAPVAAHQLLRAAFHRLAGGRVTLTAPMASLHCQELLRLWGLECNPRLRRMRIGPAMLQQREEMIYALSGPEKG